MNYIFFFSIFLKAIVNLFSSEKKEVLIRYENNHCIAPY